MAASAAVSAGSAPALPALAPTLSQARQTALVLSVPAVEVPA